MQETVARMQKPGEKPTIVLPCAFVKPILTPDSWLLTPGSGETA